MACSLSLDTTVQFGCRLPERCLPACPQGSHCMARQLPVHPNCYCMLDADIEHDYHRD